MSRTLFKSLLLATIAGAAIVAGAALAGAFDGDEPARTQSTPEQEPSVGDDGSKPQQEAPDSGDPAGAEPAPRAESERGTESGPRTEEAGPVTSGPQPSTPEEVAEYWTPERMREARPITPTAPDKGGPDDAAPQTDESGPASSGPPGGVAGQAP